VRFSLIAIIPALVLAMAACKQSQQPVPGAKAPSAVPPTATAPAAAATIWFEPASVSTCDKAAVKVVVHWNARTVAGIKSVEVRPLGPGGKESLFVLGGPLGHRETGAWMTPGRQMILRDHAGGKEIGRARLDGVACTQP
jgi:hypothetical protein